MVQRDTETATARRSKRSVAGGTPDTEPNAIVSEQRYEGLALEGVSPQVAQNVVEVKTAADSAEVEAVNREEEIIKKRKTELTTTRQIETRVKRQLLFEDGKVVEDSGPIVSTNTTEDTDKQETVQTEHRTLGDPAEEQAGEPGNRLAGAGDGEVSGDATQQQQQPTLPVDSVSSIAPKTTTTGGTIVARPPDGLLRNIKEEVVVSREETKQRTEVTEQKHFGDFTDDAYLRAINSGVDDIRELLLSEKARSELTPTGPQLVQQSISSRKVIDSEDTDIRQLAKPDGTLVTEKEQTRQHEELFDDELPETDEQRILLSGYDQVDSGERIIDQKSSAQRYFKQRDEQHVNLIGPNGEVIGHEMRYAAEQTQMDKDGGCVGGRVGGPGDTSGGLLSDWDSLSDRLRKARRLGRHPKDLAVVGQPTNNLPGVVPVLNDRLDALTKKPLDFDKEEETRKQETSKWLESHFGSESRSSRDSREDLDELVEPTKRTYFNVTIKSGDTMGGATVEPNGTPAGGPFRAGERGVPPASKFYQGVSEWTSDRNVRRGLTSSREDLLLEGSSHDAGYRSGDRHRSGSEDARPVQRQVSSVQPARHEDPGVPMHASAYLTAPRPKTNGERNFNARYGRSVSPDRHSIGQPMLDGRPTVPQRRKVLERRQVAVQQQQQQQQQLHPVAGKPAPVIVHGYAPRSRSVSPIQIPPVVTTLRKPYQKTRFSSIQDLSHAGGPHKQQQQAPPLQRAASRAQSTPPKANRVGSAIGNSIRKLMGKIRSASAERKLKLKSNTKQQQRSQSPTPSALAGGQHKRQSATYQQYNVIDGHISSSGGSPLLNHHHTQHHQHHTSQYVGDDQRILSQSQSPLAASHKPNGAEPRRESDRTRDRIYTERRGSSDILSDMTFGSSGPTPRQKYYLGENPYGGSIFGKENKYNPAAATAAASTGRDRREERVYTSSHTRSFSQPPQTNLHTLGRFSKSTNRLPTTPGAGMHYEHEPDVQYHPGGGSGYGVTSSHTLPRNDQLRRLQRSKPLHSSTINVSIVNTVNTGSPKPLANTGPVKPARTYKALNRSKSFNVHGLNGTNDPSPIYLEKLSRGPPAPTTTGGSGPGGFYRSNSHLDHYAPSKESPLQLKSPSIVNLVSRSTRDLTQNGADYYPDRTSPDGPTLDKKNVFLRNLQNRAPELYRTLHGGADTPTSRDYLNSYITREQEQTLGTRSPVTLNKDTASIVRRGSSSTDDYPDAYRFPAVHRHNATNEHHPASTQPRTKHYYKHTSGQPAARIEGMAIGAAGRYRTDTDLKYQDMSGGGAGVGTGVGGVVIELRSNT
ncbi:uncharacterized protein LOC126565650 isoform X2 [Anopheles maculipalpis]|uniref:uncharacterized protein LOC126565650 isoform X2 n=1 Tax=Anopheles maculipalpis TaxID=1496333 RepID=UPI0021593764|nr:uncharacterized protein LOC126565650 isoform X2 [Anopheles maculipalpis]